MLRLRGEFILDSSVVLSDIFENPRYQSRITKMQGDVKRFNIDCSITPTISKECEGRLRNLYNFMNQTTAQLYQYILTRKGANIQSSIGININENDYPIIRDFFLTLVSSLHSKHATEKEKLEHIETWIVKYLEEQLQSAQIISVDSFFAACIKEISRLISNMRVRLTSYTARCIQSQVDDALVPSLRASIPQIQNEKDLRIIAEVSEYRHSGAKCIFVALDYRDIIINADIIERQTGIRSSDPLYALYTLRNL